MTASGDGVPDDAGDGARSRTAAGTLDITSAGNPRIKWLVGFRRRRARESGGVTLVDGFDELSMAIRAGVTPTTVFYCPALVGRTQASRLLGSVSPDRTEIVSVSAAAFAKASYRGSPDGWLGVVPLPTRTLRDLDLSGTPLILVAESIEKPGNLGAMLRTAEAVGVRAVVAASPVTDWGNPNVVRASRGTVFAVPVASASSVEVVAWLRRKGVSVLVATPHADRLVTEQDLTVPTAVVVGAEHDGVSAAWAADGHRQGRLPMVGRVNSLNVSIAAALVLYEAVRQREGLRGIGCTAPGG